MIHVLFVDDETAVLDGLRRALRPHRARLRSSFAASGPAALALLDEDLADAVVTDMRMPGMDGVELLTEVQRRHPACARLVLSGDASVDQVRRALPVAHRLFTKPTPIADLLRALEAVERLVAGCPSLAARAAVAGLSRLPSLPESRLRADRLLARRGAIDELAELVAADVAMSAKALQLSTSTLIGTAGPTAPLRELLASIEPSLLREALAGGELESPGRAELEALATLGRHAGDAARLVGELHGDRDGGLAHSAGLLHDVGLHVEAALPAAARADLVAGAGARRDPSLPPDCHAFPGHGPAGAWLVDLWGLPPSLVQAVAQHHQPPSGEPLAAEVAVVDGVLWGLDDGDTSLLSRSGESRRRELLDRVRLRLVRTRDPHEAGPWQ